MRTHGSRTLFVCAWVLGAAFLAPAQNAHATLSLDVVSLRSGRDIHFESARPGEPVRNEEVRFTAISDEGKRYRITQGLFSPIANDHGDVLPPGTIKLFSPSSVKGVLRPTLATDLRSGTDTLYTSNAQGESDEFILVFAVELTGEEASGIYRSQMVFTLEATDGGLAPITIVRNIRLEVRSDFDVKIYNNHGGRGLDLGRITKNNPNGEGILTFEISSNLGSAYRISQQLSQELSNASGQAIDPKRITFKVSGADKGYATGGDAGMSLSPQQLYRSDERGSSVKFNVAYQLANAEDTKAGVYNSGISIQIEAEQGGIPPRTINLPVRLDVDQIFYLDVKYEGGTLNFGRFTEGKDTETRQVFIKIFNNAAAKYQISQVVSGPMSNEEGKAIDPKLFTVRVSNAPPMSSFVSGASTQVKEGDTVLFISDAKGSPAEVTLEYQLSVPKDQRGGKYGTDLTYSISTI